MKFSELSKGLIITPFAKVKINPYVGGIGVRNKMGLLP